MEPRFDFSKIEKKIYRKWEEGGYFNPDWQDQSKQDQTKTDRFVISMPPPNVTGTLHIGHGAFLSIQDLMSRYARMLGKKTLYLPGTDHAAIATQTKVEKELLKKTGKTRHALGRKKFLEEVDLFVNESKDIIRNQIRAMGASCDWSREAYTLDSVRSAVVGTVFKMMYEDGLIYRGERIVNWCPRCESTLADDEVNYEETKGTLYTIKYPLKKETPADPDESITIATTRPETMLGDTAVAVNPADKRHKKYIGRAAILPIANREIPIIADSYVDMEFGTGALKVTPAHDPNDYRLALKHKLPIVNVFTKDGSFNEQAGPLKGIKREERRNHVIAELQRKNLLRETTEHVHNVSTCYRCNTPLEPITSKQWFVDVNKKALTDNKHTKVIILPGYGADAKSNWFPWLKSALRENNIRSVVFDPPKPHLPDLKKWLTAFQEQVGKLDENTILVGHSLGSVLALHVLQQAGKKIKALVLVAPPANSRGIRPLNSFFAQEIDYSAIASLTSTIHILGSTSDMVVPQEHLRSYGTRFGVEPVFYEKRGHLTGSEFPEILPLILSCARLSLKDRSLLAVQRGEIEIIPKRFTKTYEHWIENLYDWCISRQIWFGHQIPVWYCQKDRDSAENNSSLASAKKQKLKKENGKGCGEIIVSAKNPQTCPHCGATNLVQDQDTLDTWFSSGTWTFSTLYRNVSEIKIKNNRLVKNGQLVEFHPTTILETGYDILFFWVARMILMTTYALEEVPFKKVYLHGLVRDKFGRKMSKSLGNGIDPVEMVDKYGADATRLALLLNNTPGNDLKVYEEKISGFRNFITKLWNISRYVISVKDQEKSGGKKKIKKDQEPEKTAQKKSLLLLTPADHYIIAELDKTVDKATKLLDKYRFSEAGEMLKDFTWNTFADWYLEIAKIEGEKTAILNYILDTLLRLWHPYIPFVTEEIWSQTKDKNSLPLVVSPWPQKNMVEFNPKLARQYKAVIELIAKIRSVRSVFGVPAATVLEIMIKNPSEISSLFLASSNVIEKLARVKFLKKTPEPDKKNGEQTLQLPLENGVITFFFPPEFNLENAQENLDKEKSQIKSYIKTIEAKLANKQFVAKAPKEIIAREQEKLETQKNKLKNLDF